MANGVLAGYPIVDVKAKLYDGSYHDVDSSETAFQSGHLLPLKPAFKLPIVIIHLLQDEN